MHPIEPSFVPRFMRYVYIAVTLLFLSFCAVQYNDPDPLIWIVIYGYAAVLTGLAVFRIHTPLPIPGLIIYLAGFFYLSPHVTAQWYHDEEGREALGLLISLLWMGFLLFQWIRSRKERNSLRASV
jgi:hypothetical protein